MATVFNAESKKQYNAIKTRKSRFVTYILDKDKLEIVVEKVGDKKCNWTQFQKLLPDTNCRFALYDYEYKSKDGRATSKLYAMFWNPKNTNQVNRILYSQALQQWRDNLSGCDNFSSGSLVEVKELLENEVVPAGGGTVTGYAVDMMTDGAVSAGKDDSSEKGSDSSAAAAAAAPAAAASAAAAATDTRPKSGSVQKFVLPKRTFPTKAPAAAAAAPAAAAASSSSSSS